MSLPFRLSRTELEPEAISRALSEHGAVLLRDAEPDGSRFRELVGKLSRLVMEYEQEQSTPRTRIEDGVYTSTEYPASQQIFFHCELSYAATWPARLFFHCLEAAARGGATPLADTRQVLARLSPDLRQEFRARGLLYVRHFGGTFGPSWQKTFATLDRAGVEAYCKSAGIELEWLPEGLRTRARRPAIRVHPETGEEVWFNHLALFHESNLAPGVRSRLTRLLGQDGLPQNVFFSDGSAIADELVESVRKAYRSTAVRFEWRTGDVLVLDNMKVAHGRDAFEGPRQVLVAMADPVSASNEMLRGT